MAKKNEQQGNKVKPALPAVEKPAAKAARNARVPDPKPTAASKKPATPVAKTNTKSAPVVKAVPLPVSRPKLIAKSNKVPKAPVPSPFNDAERQEFMQLLLDHRRRMLSDMDQMEDEALKQIEISPSPIHMAEMGSDVYEQDLTLGLVEKDADAVSKIDEALQRLKQGTFGICESCYRPIPKKRLLIVPFATYCVQCMENEERNHVEVDRTPTIEPEE